MIFTGSGPTSKDTFSSNMSATTATVTSNRTTALTFGRARNMKRKFLQCYPMCDIISGGQIIVPVNATNSTDGNCLESAYYGDCSDDSVIIGLFIRSSIREMDSMSILHAGWLQKMPHANHTFSKCRKRWFVLRSTKDDRYLLEYFNEPTSTKAKGLFIGVRLISSPSLPHIIE